MLHQEAVLSEGKWCENAVCQVLASCGIEVHASTPHEDHRLKVDFWVRLEVGGALLPIQFTTNREAVVNGKGTDALARGVIPSWVSAEAIEAAAESGNGSAVARQFRDQVDSVLANFRGLRLLRKEFIYAHA
jgi:hypothetical protein